jgi:hypothetical protein
MKMANHFVRTKMADLTGQTLHTINPAAVATKIAPRGMFFGCGGVTHSGAELGLIQESGS